MDTVAKGEVVDSNLFIWRMIGSIMNHIEAGFEVPTSILATAK